MYPNHPAVILVPAFDHKARCVGHAADQAHPGGQIQKQGGPGSSFCGGIVDRQHKYALYVLTGPWAAHTTAGCSHIWQTQSQGMRTPTLGLTSTGLCMCAVARS